jgi:CheY-like chemotaxis protein
VPYREAGNQPLKQPLKILFADDSATMRKVAEITFASDDYDLVTLESGADLVESVKTHQPGVVIVDADMPGVSGYDACKQLRADGAIGQIPLLLLNGPSSPYDDRRAKEAGVTEHMNKPFETQTLFNMVDSLASAPRAAAPAPKPELEVRPKVGSKTVLGLGAMGAAPPPAGAGQSLPEPAIPAPQTAVSKPAAAKPGPIASPIGTKPKGPPPKPMAKPPAAKLEPTKPQAAPAAAPEKVMPAGGLGSLSNLADESKSAEQRAAELTPEQIEAIRIVAKEVIERVVWEVIPDLAETIIKEELAKLLKE